MDGIDRASRLPYYQQLYEILRRCITSGDWRPGDRVPSESELIVEFKVSRITIRQVLDMLVREGLIYRERGRGSFVSHPTLEKNMERIVSFTDDMRQRGFRPGTRILAAEILAAPSDIADRLQIAAGQELIRLERLRLADGEPLSIEESFLIHAQTPGLLERDLENSPLREVLVRDYGIRWIRAKQVIRGGVASAATAHLLGVKANAALLIVERVSYSQLDIPAEFLRIQYRADRYAFYLELQA
jgi:GntR family transcriptional regulator